MKELWLERFVDPEVISGTSAFRVVACVDPQLARRVVVVVAGVGLQHDLVTRALDRLYRAHHEPPHAVIAPAYLRASSAGSDFVAFDFPARLDFDQLLQIGLDGGWKAPYGPADGFSTTLRDALLASAARVDAETGQPVCLGVFAHANVLFAADGSHAMIGFGHNVVVHDERHRPVVRGRFFQAPEVAVGQAPTASSDLVGMIEMTRATMAFVNVNPAIGRVIVGNTLREDIELAQLIARFESVVMRGTAARRPPVEEIVRMSDRIRELIGSVPDPPEFRRFVARLLSIERPDFAATTHTRSLVVARDGSWFEPSPGDRRDLTKNRRLGRLLRALAERRAASPGHTLSVDDLLEAGWPGERMQREAGQNRVYVAIAALRKAGLGDDLERSEAGYRVSPGVRVDFAEP